MNNKFKGLASAPGMAPIALAITFVAAPATASTTTFEREISAMGTRLSIVIESAGRELAVAASNRAIHAVEEAEARLSTWKPDTELSRVNQAPVGSPVTLSPKLARDLEGAFECSKKTEGTFNPAIGPLVAAWGLRSSGRLPSDHEVSEAKYDSDPNHFELQAGKITKKSPKAAIEEGAFGKGIGLDDALAELKASGVQSARLNFGGQVSLLGAHATEIGIADPEHRERVLLTLLASDGSVSTSGNSEHGIRVGGRSVGHLLDPRTGRPASFQGSVTVVAPTGAEADCLSTGLFVMGPKKGLAWLRKYGSDTRFQAVFVERGLARASCGLKGRLKPADLRLKLIFDCNTSGGSP